ncbi:hypothetical protein FRC01_005565 [Tulasnella sp. 417]|nr:hypothetical protein FRC01_005565 [Tulasnella sp. 417]
MATLAWPYASGLDTYSLRATVIPLIAADRCPTADSLSAENFETLDHSNNPSSPPPTTKKHITTSPPHTASRHKKRRRDSAEEEIEEAPKRLGAAPRPTRPSAPLDVRNAYLKIRTEIQEIRPNATSAESIDRSSSCAALSLDDVDLEISGEPSGSCTTDGPNPKLCRQILARMEVAVTKWQSRKRFFEFTTDLRADNEKSTIHAWRRRRTVADELLSTCLKGEEWATLVARRFTKTVTRQVAGLRAIMELRVEEESFYASTYPGGILKPDCPSRSYGLLNLVFRHIEPQSFFRDVIPQVLQSWPADKPCAVVWLARVIRAFMARIDAELMSKYGRQAIQKAERWTKEWLDAIWLLTALYLGQATWTKERVAMFSVAKIILHIGMDALGNWNNPLSTAQSPNEASRLKVLYSIILMCKNLRGKDDLHFVVPSVITLEPFVAVCIDGLGANGSLTCSALKALALLRNVPTAMESIPSSQMSILASCCMDIVLCRGVWKKASLMEKCHGDPFALIPEEDAFDVLCCLPQPAFRNALATALADCPVSLDPSNQDHMQLFDILEPLLWLSNMPPSVPEAHRALVEGSACEFLAKIILDSPQESWSWKDRAVWRVKGEAITCLGNIIERMDETELRAHLHEGTVKSIAEIRDNVEAPEAQREQAIFALQRYEATADRCAVVPFRGVSTRPEPCT